jgi:glycosyltransferase involved in cell wall biosynthesis
MKGTEVISHARHHSWKSKVSVSLLAYNHADWIAQAIESVLNQKTNFPFEIIIGEDCSDDLTLEICKSYQRKFPHHIKILASKKNIGNRKNSIRNINACAAKYIAILSGDDFWNDTNKLQDQVDFLDSNEDFSASVTQAAIEYHGNLDKRFESNYSRNQEVWNGEDVSNTPSFAAASSIVFLKDALMPLPRWFEVIAYGDSSIRGILAKRGKFHYMQRKATTYRCNNWGLLYQLRKKGKAHMAEAAETIKKHILQLA